MSNIFNDVIDYYLKGKEAHDIYRKIINERNIDDIDEKNVIINCLKDIYITSKDDFPLIPLIEARTTNRGIKRYYFFELYDKDYPILTIRAFQVLYLILKKYYKFDEIVVPPYEIIPSSIYAERYLDLLRGISQNTLQNYLYRDFPELYQGNEADLFYKAATRKKYFYYKKLVSINHHFMADNNFGSYGNGTDISMLYAIQIY